MTENIEVQRLQEAREKRVPWKKWGPYLSERQWGTVREDYSDLGNAWDYFSHDQARSRAYRWGEDGLAGFSDDKQRLCFALALWNGVDPILKERCFGLTNSEGNHGEDVKEYYYYLDSTPTHSYMKYLYKYPQLPFPYDDLVRTNRTRSRYEMEYELIDTGVFDDERYFDVFVEYAKAEAEDILIAITVHNRASEPASLHVLPTLWFRNNWSAWISTEAKQDKPRIKAGEATAGASVLVATQREMGEYRLYCEGEVPLLFTDNETNNERIFGTPNESVYVKDGIHNCVVQGKSEAVNPDLFGTKAACHCALEVPGGGSKVVRLRLSKEPQAAPFSNFEDIFKARLAEADRFYEQITPDNLDEDHGRVIRQALAGMLWTKQYYFFELDQWLEEHHYDPLSGARPSFLRNAEWFHMVNDDIISMPDKWEYPWYAAWDLAFHTIALAMVDPDFAKEQLDLMLNEEYLHPNGQIPAYEWNFSDVNPPVHAWATLFIFSTEEQLHGKGDVAFLKDAFRKLLLNFTWWINRKDLTGRNVFQGGFLGLDNIGVFDRSAPLPIGGHLEQADGTGWMAFYAQCMLQIALKLAENDKSYEGIAIKFAQHFLYIAGAMDRIGENRDEMWDEQDGFFYDVLRLPDGNAFRLKVRSMVGLLPLCASTVIPKEMIENCPRFLEAVNKFIRRHPELAANIAPPTKQGVGGRYLLSPLNEEKLRRVLAKMLDESEFLSDYGIRALSRHHLEHPYIFSVGNSAYRVDYEPAESTTGMFGGNSNWRGPIWMPVNGLIGRALLNLYTYYGDEFTVECPTGSGKYLTLYQVAQEIANRLAAIFLRDQTGKRPVFGGAEKFQSDPHWRDCILFYEYFHGDNGAGLGASHQTGWTGLVAKLIQLFGAVEGEDLLKKEGLSAGLAYTEEELVPQ
ncbi:MAG: glucosidase [Aphanocapsa lilacina HA4352-LM1]|jgi:hypothetical protein|nr:glucosidase [Aphanocapsa lilacina HA4352-LM1]